MATGLRAKTDIGMRFFMSTKTEARRAADARYEASRTPVLIRLTDEQIDAIDAVRGDLSRQEWVKQAAIKAAKRKAR